MLTLALLNLDHLILAEALLLTGYLFANLWFSALGGWLSSITALERQGTLSVWVNVANIGGGGIMAVAAGELMQRLPPLWAALAIGATVLLPIAVFPWMEAPGADRRLAKESFSQFFGELVSLVKRREVLIALALFVGPVASFSLTNFLGGLGNEFHASARLVGLVGGTGMLVGGICGCFIYPLIDRLLPLRQLYLAIGVVGAMFTLSLVGLPHSPLTFAIALIGESIFQALAFTAATAITFAAIGPNNPLAATTYGFLGSVASIPLAYMLLVDSAGYDWHGVAGGYAADAGLSLSACLVLGVSLTLLARRQRMKPQRVN